MKNRTRDFLMVGYGMGLMLIIIVWSLVLPYWIYFTASFILIMITYFVINNYYSQTRLSNKTTKNKPKIQTQMKNNGNTK